MLYRILADIVFLTHFTFIAFLIGGGFLTRWWPRITYAHLSGVAYGIAISVVGWTCPLTPLEWSLRSRATGQGYEGGWVESYIVPLIYPGPMTPAMHVGIALVLVGLTVVAYFPSMRRCLRSVRKR